MYPSIKDIRRTAAIVAGYHVGTLIYNDKGLPYLQQEDGSVIAATDAIDVLNTENNWQSVNPEDHTRIAAESQPVYAGMDARMKRRKLK
ncbi:MAG TPA: hypothetical protein VN462_11325 [Negativicutes bacterium]|nr:hypothetical protein [Negativicutes bacterium]